MVGKRLSIRELAAILKASHSRIRRVVEAF
ncbi:hypothetical protein SBV1_580006 [Verrucomicrobia bacterium]|nr:hypothetical protein SBV1_580006 [Verrucomicrobiota bacterium]